MVDSTPGDRNSASTWTGERPPPPPVVLRALRYLLGPHRAQYLNLVAMLVRRELKVKYRGSLLGYLWSMLNPLFFMIVITVVFSHMIKGVPNYNLYVLSGILMWNAISSSLSLGSGSIVANAGLLRKMRLPVWIFPMVAVSSSLTNFALALVPYMLFFLFEVRSLPNQVYLLPIVLSLFFLFLLGGALLLASLNVFFRDVSHVLDPILMIFFYATPVIYDRRLLGIPENIGRVLDLNPFTHFADAFRATLSVHGYIGWEQLLVLSGLAMASVLLGTVVYKKSVDKMIFSL